MGLHRTRREFLGIAAGTAAAAGLAAVAAAAAGCNRSGNPGGGSGSGPITVKHLFGETTVPAPPIRVVSAGLTEQDDLLAVGIKPIAITRWLGDPSGIWPWTQAELGAAQPAVLNLDNGIQVEAIGKLKPDLIVAINAGLDEASYQKLSAIAPTIAQGGGEAFFEPWKDQAATVGRAVYKAEDMTRIVDAVEAKFAAAAQANPAFKDRSVALMTGGVPVDLRAASVTGWRTDFLTAMGMKVAGPADADVVVWCTDNDDQRTALLADPAVSDLRATRQGRAVFTGPDLAAAIAYASPLSYPMVAEQLPALLARALS